jgi:putative aldouronate transport system substrate-binding protein
MVKATSQKEILVRYVCPGSDTADQEKVVAEVNKKMKKDGLNLKLKVVHIGWDMWDNKTNVMLASGEEFELFHVMENRVPTSVFVAKNALRPLDDLLKKYGSTLLKMFPSQLWEAAKVNGKIYTIPAYWRDTTQSGGEVGTISVRKDLLDKVGLSIPKTVDELINAATKMKKIAGRDYYCWDHELNRTPVWLHRTYSTWPFYADYTEGIVYVDEKGNVKTWVETPEFKQDCMIYRKMYKLGLIHPDILSVPKDMRSKMISQGKFLFGLGTGGYTDYPSIVKYEPKAKIEEFKLNPEKGNYVFLPLWNSNAVPRTTKHPEAGVMFLNWLYSKKENHDLFLFGIKNVHYKEIDQYRAEFTYVNSTERKYMFDFWQIGYYKWAKFDKLTPQKGIELLTTTDPKAKYSIVVGFSFNPEPVKSEYANVLAEMTNSILPIKLGVVDYDKYFPTALKKLKAAGLDKVVAEYRKQFTKWLSEKKK